MNLVFLIANSVDCYTICGNQFFKTNTKHLKRRNNFRKPTDDRSNFKINGEIRVPEVRLVGDNFDEISEIAGKAVESGVFRTRQVLDWSRALELDVVEISPNAKPPVVKIIDFNKFLYLKKKKEKEIKGKTAKTVIKRNSFWSKYR